MHRFDVTIVMCTYNRAALLAQALESLVHLDGDVSYEIVVVDNASTDNTAAVLAECCDRDFGPSVRGVCERQKGVSYARNRGIEEAQGEWIAFFDDDQIADRKWLEVLYRTAKEQGVRCVGGRICLMLPSEQIEQLSPTVRGYLGATEGMQEAGEYSRKVSPGTGSLLVHRSVFDEVGVFDPSLREGGEDTDLFRRMREKGIRAWYTPEAVAEHTVPPCRLQPAYLLWTAERNGWHIARREGQEWGRRGLPFLLPLRIGQAAIRFVPRLVSGHLRRCPEDVLGARCLLRRFRGYFAGSLHLMFPKLLPETLLAPHLDFRRPPGEGESGVSDIPQDEADDCENVSSGVSASASMT